MAPHANKNGRKLLFFNSLYMLILCREGKELILGIKHIEKNTNIELINTIGLNLVIRDNDLNNDDFFYTNAQMIIFRALLAWLSIIMLLIFGGFFI